MTAPHVLGIRYNFVLGQPQTFLLPGMNFSNVTDVRIYETNPGYHWTVASWTVLSPNQISITATPNPTLGPIFESNSQFADGGGDGTTTIVVSNSGVPDPAPPTLSTHYSDTRAGE